MEAVESDQPAGPPLALTRLKAELVARCRCRLTELTESLAARYRHELAAHGQITPPCEIAGIRNLAKGNIETLLYAVEGGDPLDDGAPDQSFVEPILASGLLPAAILSAHEAATGAVWQLMTEEVGRDGLDADSSAQILSSVGATLFDVAARGSSALRRRMGFDGPGSSQYPRDELRREVFNALLVSPNLGERTLREAAERVGYRLSEAHVVALFALNGSAPPSSAGSEILSLLSHARFGALDPLIEWRASEVVAIYPVARRGPRRRLVERLGPSLREAASEGRLDARVAFGGLELGAVGIAVSYEQARRALDAALATACDDRAVSYPDMLPALLLLDSPRLAADLRRWTIESLLAHDAEQGSDLVVTLRAMVSERGNVSAAAKRLHVHRHTLTTRQERIERLTGLRLRSPRDLLLLELGLKTLDLNPTEPGSARALGNGRRIVRLRSASRSTASL